MNVDRRDFLTGMIGTVALSTISRDLRLTPAMAATVPTGLATDPRRPQFHLLPAANWMNDPNGPIYWKDRYHMFYQYNPNGAFWGDMHWGHAISPDMVHWKHLPVALAPTPGGPDSEGVFSGTAVVQEDHIVMIYTGVRASPEEQATIKDGEHVFRETQCLAVANDSALTTFTKLPQPVIAAPPPAMQVSGFRDPSPWRQGDLYYMTVGSGIPHQNGTVLLYKSKDLRNWEYVHIVASGEGSKNNTANPVDSGDMWECPELFQLGNKHVLIYSTEGKTHWQSGDLDLKEMRFHPEQRGLLDFGSYYAAKTQLDKHGNRIVWGWVPETRSLEEYKSAGWAGLMSLPRALTLGDDGRLRIRPSEEVNQLRGRKHSLDVTTDEARNQRQISAMRVEGCCGEILCTSRRMSESFEFALQSADGAATWLTVRYDKLHPDQILIQGKPHPLILGDHEDIEVHLYVDGSVIELFVNQQIACSVRFYPTGANPQDLRMQWIGKTTNLMSLCVWQMLPISADRLTT